MTIDKAKDELETAIADLISEYEYEIDRIKEKLQEERKRADQLEAQLEKADEEIVELTKHTL